MSNLKSPMVSRQLQIGRHVWTIRSTGKRINADDYIQGKVYDVTGNKAYQPGGSYNGKYTSRICPPCMFVVLLEAIANKIAVFAGKDASRALGKTSTKAEDVSSEWQDLEEKEKGTLNDWVTFFSKRYNVVGVVAGATNME